MGDDIQAIKAGIMEIGDVFVINKADREGVLRTQKELEALLSLAHRPDMWNPPIVKTDRDRNKGIEDLVAAIEAITSFRLNSEGSIVRRQGDRKMAAARAFAGADCLSDLMSQTGTSEKLDGSRNEIAEKKIDPYSAVEEILSPPEGSIHIRI